jgi:branched-chain amino acid transport system permease protein
MLGYLIVSGITSGALYALVAMGLVIVYKATRVVNLAQGELFMLSGFFAFTCHVQLGLPYLASLVIAVIGAFIVGTITYRIAFRPLMKAGLVSVLLATIALSFIMKGLARNIWGGIGDYIPFPPLITAEPIMVGSILVLPQQLVVLLASIVLMLGFAAFFKLARVGKWMEATADNTKAAMLVGIPVGKLHQLAFALGASAAGAAAVLMAPLTQLYPDVGFNLFIKAFAAAVLGGLQSTLGAVIGGLIVGLIESLAAGYLKSSVQDVAAFIVIMFALLFIPRGIMGGRQMRRV